MLMVDTLGQLKRTAERTLDLSFTYSEEPGGIRWRRWDWSIGVAFYGIWKAYVKTGEEQYLTLVRRWIDERIDDKIEKICVNSNSPLLVMLKLSQIRPDSRYEELFRTFDRYLMSQGRRTPSGALEHTVLDNNWAHQVWADTIFMSLLYMAERGCATGNEAYRREAFKQLHIHYKLLFDPEEKLFYHGWNDEERRWIGTHWGRGNAWMTAGTVEMLELAPADWKEREEVLELLHQQLGTLARLQDPSGLWRTVINRADTYLEVSVTAGIAYGVLKGIRLGLLDPQYREMGERALKAVAAKIDESGNVTGGSTGTPVKQDAAEYNKIGFDITPFTQGLALLALSEGL